MSAQPNPRQQVEQQAARCVQCALCLPHCPTFRLYGSENESPRGRIALARAIASGALDDAAAWRHLDSCIECSACTDMCPSKVNYDLLRCALYSLDRRPVRIMQVLLLGAHPARLMAARLHWLLNKIRVASF